MIIKIEFEKFEAAKNDLMSNGLANLKLKFMEQKVLLPIAITVPIR
jgi:hypothetical protein